MKKKGITGMITSIVLFLIVAGFILAVIREYDGDVLLAIERVIEGMWRTVERIAEMFTGNRSFRRVIH